MPASGDAAHRRRGLDWPHALVELATVVIGILIALAVNNWAEARHNVALEARYLERLLADSAENLTMLQERIDLLTRRTDQLTRLSRWLTGGTERPTDGETSEVLRRWFIQPALRLRRETYAELVSTGNLSLCCATCHCADCSSKPKPDTKNCSGSIMNAKEEKEIVSRYKLTLFRSINK